MLGQFPEDYLVIMSSDGEGNQYSPCADVSGPCMYEPESTWSGAVRDKEELGDDEYKENAVVLCPTN